MHEPIELVDHVQLKENERASLKVSDLAYSRIKKSEEIKLKISGLPNNPEKIFQELNLPVVVIDGVQIEGVGFKRTFTWNGKQYKRPELVAKAFYEAKGYQVTWSEGVAWGIALKGLMSMLSIKFSKYFEVKDLRSAEIEVAVSVAANKQELFEIHELHGPSLYIEVAKKNVEDRYRDSVARLNGENGLVETRIRSIAQAVYDGDEFSLKKHLDAFKLTTDFNINELKEKLQQVIQEIHLEKDVVSVEMYLPTVGDKLFNEHTDKRNLNEWSIKFAGDVLRNMSWKKLYDRMFESNGGYETRFDLTAVNYSEDEVKFVEVKLDDKFTEWQMLDLINSVQYDLPIELAVIKS